MPIHYYLQLNTNTPDPNDHYARVETSANRTLRDVAETLVREGTGTSVEQVEAILAAGEAVQARFVGDGDAVNTPLHTIRPGITGVFTNATDQFDPSRHTARANLSPGPLLEVAMAAATTQKTDRGAPSPHPTSYTDLTTGSVNGILSPAGLGRIAGSQLKYTVGAAGNGIFFVAISGGAQTAVAQVSPPTDGEVTFIVPGTLTAGQYRLEVRRSYGTDLRIGTLSFQLTVA